MPPEITRRLIDRFVSGVPPTVADPPELAGLTARERVVLTLLARGLSNTEIGASVYITEGTVKTHVTRILSKLRLRDRVQAVVYAYEHQLIQPGR